jgi:hypothetical protein
MAEILDVWASIESCCESSFSKLHVKNSISGKEGGDKGKTCREGGGLQLKHRSHSKTRAASSNDRGSIPEAFRQGGRLGCGFWWSQNITKLYHRSVNTFPVRSKSSHNHKPISHCNFRNQNKTTTTKKSVIIRN